MDSATFRGKLSGEMDYTYWTFPTSVPTIGSVRNKIVLIRTCRRNLTDPNRPMIAGWDWPGNGLEWNGFAVSGLSWNYFFVTQNFWHGEGGTATGPGGMGDGPGGVGGVTGTYKGDQVERYISDSANGRNPLKLYLNFLSRADTNIGVAAADINLRISNYIESNHPGRHDSASSRSTSVGTPAAAPAAWRTGSSAATPSRPGRPTSTRRRSRHRRRSRSR